jgi:hypothetical protein
MWRRIRRHKRTDVSEKHNAYISGFDSSGMTVNFYQYTHRQNHKKKKWASPRSHHGENPKSYTSNYSVRVLSNKCTLDWCVRVSYTSGGIIWTSDVIFGSAQVLLPWYRVFHRQSSRKQNSCLMGGPIWRKEHPTLSPLRVLAKFWMQWQ